VVNLAEKIMVYALSTCPYCKRTKRFLDEHKVLYNHKDVDTLPDDEQDKILEEVEKLTGRRSFPVVIIGTEIIVGHDETRLKKALHL
jgi:glutaredoxin